MDDIFSDPRAAVGIGLLSSKNIGAGLAQGFGLLSQAQDRQRAIARDEESQKINREMLEIARYKAHNPRPKAGQFVTMPDGSVMLGDPYTGQLSPVGSGAAPSMPAPQPFGIQDAPGAELPSFGGGMADLSPTPLPALPGSGGIDLPRPGISPIPSEFAGNPKASQKYLEGAAELAAKRNDPLYQSQIEEAERKKREAAQAQTDRQSKLEADIAAAEGTIGLVDELTTHPGFESSVGLKGITARGYGVLPWVEDKPIDGTDAAGFSERLKQLGGRQFLAAFETLKGGGQITQVEGEKAQQAIARMGTSQSEAEFLKAAQDYKDAVSIGIAKLKKQAGIASQGEPEDRDALMQELQALKAMRAKMAGGQ